jgi:hypothetical protein
MIRFTPDLVLFLIPAAMLIVGVVVMARCSALSARAHADKD